MRAVGRKPVLTLALLGGAVVLGLLGQGAAHAGGPLLVGGTFGTPGQPFLWDTTSPISYHTDQGPLGNQTNTQANNLVQEGFDVWQNTVPTASISFLRSGDLGQDVNGSNFMNLFNTHENCAGASSFTNIIVYDNDGAITDAVLGDNQSNSVLGFASAVCVDSLNHFTRGEVVLNGLFIDGLPDPNDPLLNKFKEVFTHEFGHLIGLDHSQVNLDVLTGNFSQDNLFGLPLMFPFLIRNTPARVDQNPPFPPLAPDDEAWLSFLYQSGTFNSQFGLISGQIQFSDLTITPLQGANVIARQQSDGNPANGDESRRNAVSVVSGYLFTGNPGQVVTCSDPQNPSFATCSNFSRSELGPGSDFGSRDPTLIGFYRIPVKGGGNTDPVPYTVEVESIDPDFVAGSSVGPLGDQAGEQIPLPGPAEFLTTPESATDDPNAPGAAVSVTVGTEQTGTNIVLNGTPSRFDSFESARLWLREPAPAWVRREIPLDSTVAG